MAEKYARRKQQARETRQKILMCALDLFERKGYDDVTMLEIAETAQTSVGSIYRYFKSKDEIAAQSMEPLDDSYNKFFEELTSSETFRGKRAIEKLEAFYLFVQKTVSQYSNLRSLYIYCLKNPENNDFIVSDTRRLYFIYCQLLAQCREEGSIREDLSDDRYLDLLLQSSRGMLLDWLLHNESFDFECQARKWWGLIQQFIQKEPA